VTSESSLEELAASLRTHSALLAKGEIALVREVFGESDGVSGPGDDGAVVAMSDATGDGRGVPDQVVVCGEALLPEFVARDPFGAGLAAVLTNVNDLAAMGADPRAIVDTVAADRDTAREVLRGMQAGSALYDVPLVGGHLTVHTGHPSVSAFGVGRAARVLSSTNVAADQQLLVATCTDGTLRADFPFFGSFDERGTALAGDVRLLAELAGTGACVAAKDVSMAGLVGSVGMLLEWSHAGVTLDLDALPRPGDVPLADWLTCFPAYSFVLCSPPERTEECLEAFRRRGLDAAVLGTIDETGMVALRAGQETTPVLDLVATGVTGLVT
jgi:selenophosphate synthetase-related protein